MPHENAHFAWNPQIDVTQAARNRAEPALRDALDKEFGGITLAPEGPLVESYHEVRDAGEDPPWTAIWRVKGVHDAGHFLGWPRTGRPIEVLLVTVGNPPATHGVRAHTEWDRLRGLSQLGIRATGRPRRM